MAIYRYQHDSLVDTVHILTNEKGGLRAYLYADNGKDTERLRLLKQALRAQGYKCVPTLSEGKPVLEVRGFKKANELVDYLQELSALTGKPEFIKEVSDTRTTKEKLDGATLKMAGLSYNIGDAAYVYYATGPVVEKLKANPAEYMGAANKGERFFDIIGIIGGLGYMVGSYCLTFFGAKDQSINTITTATSKVERFARLAGYDIVPESSIAYANHEPKSGGWEKIKHTIGRYPSEALNSIYVGVGICLSAVAFYKGTRSKEMLKEFKELEEAVAKNLPTIKEKTIEFEKAVKWQKWDRIDVGLGAVTTASALTGLAVNEQKRLPSDPKRHGIAGVVDWVKEKPLRVTGIGYGIATLFHAIATVGKWKDGEPTKYLIGRAIFIAANVFSEGMLFISSKGHGIGVKPDNSINDSVISAAAELVLRQPHEKREAIISQLSGYIASPDVLAIKAGDVEKSIREHIAELDRNPWTKHYMQTASGTMVEAAPEQKKTASLTQPSSSVTNVSRQSKDRELELAL